MEQVVDKTPDEKRLANLCEFLAQERASKQPSKLYIVDLEGEIKRLEKRIKCR